LPAELDMTRNTSELPVCCSSASARCSRASLSSWERASSFLSRSRTCAVSFFTSGVASRDEATRIPAFVPVARSLRLRVPIFAPLRDKVTSSAQSLVPFRRAQLRIEALNLPEQHDELAPSFD